MATINSNGTGGGNYSEGSSWAGGVAPTSIDDVVIIDADTITLDTNGLAANTVTINTGGTLGCTTTASWDLTVEIDIDTVDGATPNTLNLDMSGNVSYTGIIYLNNSGAGGRSSGYFSIKDKTTTTIKGFPKTRKTTLNGEISAGATSAIVDDAIGWQVGDKVVFATTQEYNITPRTDVITIVTVNTVTGAITWAGGITYDHTNTGYVGNLTSNMVIRPATPGDQCAVTYKGSYFSTTTKLFDNVEFYSGGQYRFNAFGQMSAEKLKSAVMEYTVSNCAFHEFIGSAVVFYGFEGTGTTIIDTCIIFSRQTTETNYAGGIFMGTSVTAPIIKNCGIFELPQVSVIYESGNVPYGAGISFGQDGVQQNCQITDTFISGVPHIGSRLALYNGSIGNVEIFGCLYGVCFHGCSGVDIDGLHLGSRHSATNGTNDLYYLGNKADVYNSDIAALDLDNIQNALESTKLRYYNLNQDFTAHEEHTPFYSIKRNNVTFNRSTSSIEIQPLATATDSTRVQKILCANGASITVVGYCQFDANFYNSNDYTAPTVELSGLGESAQVYAASLAANGAWEKYTLTITNNSGTDGEFDLIYTATAKTVTTGKVYFDGVPEAPWVTKCRHYGYILDESSPIRVIDIYSAVNEATAAAYTGATYNNSTQTISFAAGTADTLQKFYDHIQSILCANLDYVLPFTRAGTSLLLDDDTTVIDPYYAGELTWSSGTVAYSSGGTKSDNLDGCIVEYDNGSADVVHDGTITGTLDLRNLDAGTMTVTLPIGTSYTIANNIGGTITVANPEVSLTTQTPNIIDGSAYQIKNITTDSILTFGTTSGGTGIEETYTLGTDYSDGDNIRVRITWQSGPTAKEPIEYNLTAGAVTEINANPITQVDATIYNTYAIDGAPLDTTNGGPLAWNGGTMDIDVTDLDHTMPGQDFGAWYYYYITTESGIESVFGAFDWISINRIVNITSISPVKVSNTDTENPLIIADTWLSRDDGQSIIATTSGSIQINPPAVFQSNPGQEVIDAFWNEEL